MVCFMHHMRGHHSLAFLLCWYCTVCTLISLPWLSACNFPGCVSFRQLLFRLTRLTKFVWQKSSGFLISEMITIFCLAHACPSEEDEEDEVKHEILKESIMRRTDVIKKFDKTGKQHPEVVGKNPTEPKQPVNDEEPELVVPGTLLFICGGQPIQRPENTGKSQGREGHVLLKGHPGTGFGPIILSGNMLTDHKCENVYYALRDVLKGLPKSGDTGRLFL